MRASNRNKVGSFGLVGIEERISLLGGVCSIIGSPNAGTTVAISVPIDHVPPPSTDEISDMSDTGQLSANVIA